MNAKIQYSVHQSLPVVPVLNQINPLHILPARSSYLCLGLPFVEVFLLKPSMHFSFPPYIPLALPMSYIDKTKRQSLSSTVSKRYFHLYLICNIAAVAWWYSGHVIKQITCSEIKLLLHMLLIVLSPSQPNLQLHPAVLFVCESKTYSF